LAMMPKAAQMPNENYREGQKLRLVITEVSKDTKGAQVLVSRADAKLVKRLFEKEVPEIYQGIVEIKAIAREAGERTKMAVHSKREDVDPIGACIGPRGSRVQVVIEELKGEKIDIFEWSENITELIKNALSPAQILAVVPTAEKRGLLVVVEDNQLSLAIGKKGKNARLAVRLTGMRIDIKSRTEVETQGINWKKLMQDYALEQESKILEKKAAKLAEEKAREAANAPIVEIIPETVAEIVEAPVKEVIKETVRPVSTFRTEPVPRTVEPRRTEVKTPEVKVPEVKIPEVEKPIKVKAVKKELKERKGFVSKLEVYADAPKVLEKKEKDFKKKPFVKETEERRVKSSVIRKDKDYTIAPVYSEAELEEIKKAQELETKKTWYEEEVDFDEFEAYYDKEE